MIQFLALSLNFLFTSDALTHSPPHHATRGRISKSVVKVSSDLKIKRTTTHNIKTERQYNLASCRRASISVKSCSANPRLPRSKKTIGCDTPWPLKRRTLLSIRGTEWPIGQQTINCSCFAKKMRLGHIWTNNGPASVPLLWGNLWGSANAWRLGCHLTHTRSTRKPFERWSMSMSIPSGGGGKRFEVFSRSSSI